jgi:hypothetical protein
MPFLANFLPGYGAVQVESLTSTGRVTGAGFTSSIRGTAATPAYNWSEDPDNGPYYSGVANRVDYSAGGTDVVSHRSGLFVSYGSSTLVGAVVFSGVVSLGANSYLVFTETAAPGAAATDTVRMYAVVDGGGKTDLVAVFQSGAAQTVAQEP